MKTVLAHWRSPLAVTLILILFIAAASFVMTSRVNSAEEANSFERLANEAEELVHNLELNVSSDRRQLELIAGVADNYMDSSLDELIRFLGNYHGSGTFVSRLELLLPGDRVISASGVETDASGLLSFEEEAALGAHISDRELDLDGENYVVRHFVPITFGGETVAMLCGVIELSELNSELPYSPYGGDAAVYVIDGATGDFLLDTWHNTVGNIWETEPRPLADGYNHEQLREGLINGESNYVIFVSNTTGEYLYFYYTPIGINQWRVALSVPEDVVFADSRSIRSMLNALLICEGAAFLLYLLWLIRYVRRETGEKQRQLDALSYIYDVEKLLFDAHEHLENIPRALEVIARMLPAKRVTFTMLDSDGPGESYVWDAAGGDGGEDLSRTAQALAGYFAEGHTEYSGGVQAVRRLLPGDLEAVPVEDAGGAILGVLTASGLSRPGCAAMLKSVAFSFAKLCGNARTYRAMRLRGERDALTGLLNRNRYELDLPRLPGECSSGLGCVFVDANGLHELNNTHGHEAGDSLLRAVADELRARFGDRHTYRIGGDEFVSFVPDGSAEELDSRCRALVDSLDGAGCFIAAGSAWQSDLNGSVESLVKTAEKHMYDAKRSYYSDPSHDRRKRPGGAAAADG